MGKLFFIGDSITAGAWDNQGGWANRLIGQIMDKTIEADFKDQGFYCLPYNLGVSGDTVPDILSRIKSEVQPRLDQDNPNEKVQFVFSIGVNDSIYMVDEKRPRFSDDEFHENLQSLISLSKTLAHSISFIGLLPVDDSKLDPIPWAPDKSYSNIHVKRFERLIEKACETHGIHFFPMFERLIGAEDYKKYLIDGVHPNTNGHAFMEQQIKQFLLTEDFVRFHISG